MLVEGSNGVAGGCGRPLDCLCLTFRRESYSVASCGTTAVADERYSSATLTLTSFCPGEKLSALIVRRPKLETSCAHVGRLPVNRRLPSATSMPIRPKHKIHR
jgi:hypothetical protein